MFRNVPKTNSATVSGASSPGIYRGNRSSGRGGRGRGGGGSGLNSRRPNQQDPNKRGLFTDGIWLCNCAPRLPAEHFKVKKEGKNQGRWFYTCQNSEGRRCDFFLWDEDAKPREEAAVLSGRRDEPRATPGAFANVQSPAVRDSMGPHVSGGQTVTSQMSTQSQDAPPPYSLVADSMPMNGSMTLGRSTLGACNNHTNNSNNNSTSATLGRSVPSASSAIASSTTLGRSAQGSSRNIANTTFDTINSNNNGKRSIAGTDFDFDDNDADAFPWDLTGQEADELEQRASHAPETPRKAIKTTAYATPATTGKRQLPWLDYTSENTPNNSTAETPTKSATLPTPSHTKTSTADATTPTPSRFHNPLAAPSASSELTAEVFTLLISANIALPQDTSAQLRAILNKHDLKSQGVSKGRDIVRLALKARDAKVVELNARIAALEAEREVDRARIRGLRLKDSTFD